MALYRALYENRASLLIIDDCDSVLTDKTALNILKSALDDKPVRVISYLTMKEKTGLPLSFEYTGKSYSSQTIDQRETTMTQRH